VTCSWSFIISNDETGVNLKAYQAKLTEDLTKHKGMKRLIGRMRIRCRRECRYAMPAERGFLMVISSSDRVARGGGWNSRARSCRSAARSINSPGDRDSNLGFRLAKSGE